MTCCDSLFDGLPNSTITKLWNIQNSKLRFLLSHENLLTLLPFWRHFIGYLSFMVFNTWYSLSPTKHVMVLHLLTLLISFILTRLHVNHAMIFWQWSTCSSMPQISTIWWTSILCFKTHHKKYLSPICFPIHWLYDLPLYFNWFHVYLSLVLLSLLITCTLPCFSWLCWLFVQFKATLSQQKCAIYLIYFYNYYYYHSCDSCCSSWLIHPLTHHWFKVK